MFLKLSAFLFSAFLTIPAWANYSLALLSNQEAQRDHDRKTYNEASKLLLKGQRANYQQVAESLRDYPLYPYLKYNEYSRYISHIDKEELDEFLVEFADTPLANRLRRQWIRSLARQKKWETYLSEYQPGQYNAQYDCYYYWALYKTEQREAAFEGARKLWLVGKSQHKACDPLFEVWKTTGEMEGQLAWERTALAMEGRKLQLAKYLENHIPKNKKPISREWRDVYRDPKRLKYLPRYSKWGDESKPIIITGFERLIRKDPELAQQLWPRYLKQFAFTQKEQASVELAFAEVLAIRRQDNAEYWLNQAAQNTQDQKFLSLGVRHALYEQDWSRVQRWLALMGDTHDQAPWQYWSARSTLKNGDFNTGSLAHIRIDEHRLDVLAFHQQFINALYDKNSTLYLYPESILKKSFTDQQPKQRLQTLAKERNFYGFLASNQLQQPLNLNFTPTQVREEDLSRISQLPAVMRARELHALGKSADARSEWHYLIRRLNEEDRSALAHLAFIWGWHNPAILAAYRSDAYNNLEIRFPTAYENVVSKHAQQAGLEEDWVYSLIRQESAFMPQAKSPVGALGMMQIMPNTAKELSRSLGIMTPNRHQMLTPDINVHLGTHYMSQLLSQFHGNMILATAAYNAGPHRAKSWQPKYLPVEGDIWIETIPFKETREYVQNILTYQAIYRHHLGKDVKLSNALTVIPAKQMQATAMHQR